MPGAPTDQEGFEMRNSLRIMAVAIAAAATLPLAGVTAQAATTAVAPRAALARAPFCGITWGSGAKSVAAGSGTSITAVRAGRHACFDRFVIDGASFARVAYVTTVFTEGQGAPVPLRGGARLAIVTNRSESPTTGRLTFHPANPKELVNFAGFATMRQAAFAGSFEGQTTIGLGVRARLPFRVFVLRTAGQPSRVVIDVAHRW
jgi:hypothetical protein